MAASFTICMNGRSVLLIRHHPAACHPYPTPSHLDRKDGGAGGHDAGHNDGDGTQPDHRVAISLGMDTVDPMLLRRRFSAAPR